MTEMHPAPPLPAEVDLRGLEWMPLYGARLFGSDFAAHASDSAFRTGLQLWWAAWNQVPAASLPDDDVALCRLAGLGRDLRTWKRLKLAALRGFVLCADGRLYHRTLAVWALEAWHRRLKDRARKAKWRVERERRAGGDGDGARDGDRDVPGTAERTGEDRTGEEKTGEERTLLATRAQARLITEQWQPTEEALTRLRKARPDLVGSFYEQRMEQFGLWCRANAVVSHDAGATWMSFMLKSRASATTSAPSWRAERDGEIERAIASRRFEA